MAKQPSVDQMCQALAAKGGSIKDIERHIRQSKGEFAGKRVQRAADEIPNLERMFNPETLKFTFERPDASLMSMNPADFEKFAERLNEDDTSAKRKTRDSKILDFDDYLKHLAKIKGGFDEVPYLELGHRDPAYLPSIEGHEGRHRSRVLSSKGAKKSLVQLMPTARMRMSMPMKPTSEATIQKMKQILGEKRLVTPEGRSLLPADLTAQEHRNLENRNLLAANRPQLPELYNKGGNVEVRPTVKDEAIQRKNPSMEAAARKVSEGKMSHEAYDKVVNKHKPVKPYEFVPKPATDEDANRALKSDQKDKWRGHEKWPAGRKVGLRLDIPAYENHGVWVNSIHDEEGKKEDKLPTTYNSVSSVKNATFDPNPDKAVRVATGELNKSPFARIKGELHHMTEDEAVEHIRKNLHHPDYAQVGMDPRRHGYFYDRKTLKPVTHAKHVVQIGPLVLAHKPTYGERESYARGGIIHKAQGGTVKPSVDQMKKALAKRHGFAKHKHGEKVGGYDVGDKIKNYGSYASSGIDDVEKGIHRVPLSAFEVTHPNKLFYAKNDIDHVHKLAEQIKQNKYMDPLLVAMDKKGAYVLEGGHRLGAAHLLGMKEIPAMIGHEPENYAQGGTVKPFDYENPEHVENVANIAAKHRDFNKIPDVAKHLAQFISQGSYKSIEDPRIQMAIKKAGYDGYHVNVRDDKRIMRKAMGGSIAPSINQMRGEVMNNNRFKWLSQLQSIGANEAPSMGIKAYVPTVGRPDNGEMPVGGVDTSKGDLPIGGIDMSQQQAGQQLMPNAPAGQQPGMDQVPQGDKIPTTDGTGMPPMPNANPNQMGSNILSMTPQGQAMAAMKPQGLAEGGQPSVDQMKAELAAKKDPSTEKRVTVAASGSGGVKGIVVPKHLIEGNPKAGAEGLKNMMDARAKVYGEEHREPLNLGQMGKIHKQTLEEHFAKPLAEQKNAEQEALNKIRSAKFIKHNKDTLDESEKLDTVEHEHDDQGRSHVGYASKGIAGHALFPKGHGDDMDYKVINTCPGQTEGCGGGKSAEGIVDTKQGTCFAPNAESQYAAAVSRRAGHAIAKHDPAMTRDWIIAHTGSMRNAANRADKQNKRMLYRPNVVDETDVSSRHVIRHLNDQRKMDDKPPIIANSYGKTNELHDPENGYHVTHSNVGPKVKKGQEISENVARDKARVRNTVMAADNQGDFKNEQGNKTPPKGSYMVTDVKRGSPMAKKMEGAITHAKYWTTGRPESELSHEEREEGPEGHYSGTGRKTSEDQAHYGHTTHEGLRYDYQKQHVLHPRLVQVGKNDDGTPHIIPTDSRFKDEEFLPKNRFKTKNGKNAGHILMTTPTESTSNIGHQTSFTHNVSDKHIEHAEKNNGEYEIDKPEDQAKAKGKEYAAPQTIQFKPKPKAYAMGGSVGGRHIGFSDDDFHAFPEQNVIAQRHLAMRGDDHEAVAKHGMLDHKRKVTINKDLDTMLLELTRKKKVK